MELNKAEHLCRSLMNSHGLGYWRFEWDNSLRRFGVCKFNRVGILGTIGLSRHLVLLNNEIKVTDVILHEIAHALVGRGHGHDAVWKRKCIEIGAKPERCYSHADTETPSLKYKAECGACGKVYQKARIKDKERARACKCQSHRGWDEKVLLKFIDTKK